MKLNIYDFLSMFLLVTAIFGLLLCDNVDVLWPIFMVLVAIYLKIHANSLRD